jgi:hypothetical protein
MENFKTIAHKRLDRGFACARVYKNDEVCEVSGGASILLNRSFFFFEESSGSRQAVIGAIRGLASRFKVINKKS